MFNFEPDDLQKECFMHIDNNNNLLVSMPTGCGKTAIGIYAISKTLKENKRIIYTTPIKSLSNEKYKDFREIFGIDNVGIMTGDNQINPDGKIVIMTTEILRNDLYKKDVELGCVIFDEVHYINDEDRGTIWEEAIILLDPSIQLILLSATINKPHEFTNWITKIKNRETKLVLTLKRPVPLVHYIWNDGIHKIMENDTIIKENFTNYKNNNKSLVSNVIKLLKYLETHNMLQAIYFSFSRKMCEKLAESINTSYVTDEEQTEIKGIFEKNMGPFKNKYESLNQYYKIQDLIMKGIGFHHSGLAPILKEIVEILFKKKLLKVLFVTETFAVGINMPTRTVIFTELTKYTKKNKRLLNVTEYKQMSGRAGRRGIDRIGNVIIMPDKKELKYNELRQILTGNLPSIISKLNINYQILLKLLVSEKLTLEYIINSSMFGRDMENNINELKEKKNELMIEENIIKDVNCKKLYELEEITENVFTSVKQKKIISDLKKKCDKTIYEKYKTQIKLKRIYDDYTCKILKEETKIENLKLTLYSILEQNEFINNNKITQKGIIATYMNECNSLLMTDILYENILNDMTIHEIAGLLGIFVDDNKENDITIEEIISKPIKTKIYKINEIIKKYKTIEETNGIDNDNYWTISYQYVNPIHDWSEKINFSKDIFKENMYEGNFIRAVIKVVNITKNLITMCEINENFELQNKLAQIEESLMRDYVSTSSLYVM